LSRDFSLSVVFSLTATLTTQIYTLSLHDALPIWLPRPASLPSTGEGADAMEWVLIGLVVLVVAVIGYAIVLYNQLVRNRQLVERSEEHTSELQSRENLVCRLLLEKKKKTKRSIS